MNDSKRASAKKMAISPISRADLLAVLQKRRASLIRRFTEHPPCNGEFPTSLLAPIAVLHGVISALEVVEAEVADRGAGDRPGPAA